MVALPWLAGAAILALLLVLEARTYRRAAQAELAAAEAQAAQSAAELALEAERARVLPTLEDFARAAADRDEWRGISFRAGERMLALTQERDAMILQLAEALGEQGADLVAWEELLVSARMRLTPKDA